jgi:hypothetical protein
LVPHSPGPMISLSQPQRELTKTIRLAPADDESVCVAPPQ